MGTWNIHSSAYISLSVCHMPEQSVCVFFFLVASWRLKLFCSGLSVRVLVSSLCDAHALLPEIGTQVIAFKYAAAFLLERHGLSLKHMKKRVWALEDLHVCSFNFLSRHNKTKQTKPKRTIRWNRKQWETKQTTQATATRTSKASCFSWKHTQKTTWIVMS